jgi:ABC-type Fe3+ transport system permease subunit
VSGHIPPRWTVWLSTIVLLLIAASFFNHVFDVGLLGNLGKGALIVSLLLGFIVLYVVLGAQAKALDQASKTDERGAYDDSRSSMLEKEVVRLTWVWVAVVLGVPAIGWCLSDFHGGWSGLAWIESIAALSAAWFVFRQRRNRRHK